MWKLGDFRGTSAHFRRIFKQVQRCIMSFYAFAPLTRPADFFKCSNACRPFSVGCTLAKDQVIYLCACVEVGRLSWYISALSTHFQTSATVHYVFLCLLRLSHDLQTFLNVLMHVDLFRGMYTSQGSGDILVRMCGSWETFVVHLRTFDAFSNK